MADVFLHRLYVWVDGCLAVILIVHPHPEYLIYHDFYKWLNKWFIKSNPIFSITDILAYTPTVLVLIALPSPNAMLGAWLTAERSLVF